MEEESVMGESLDDAGLVGIPEVALMLGVSESTVRNYNAAGCRAFRENGKREPTDFPEEATRVHRTYVKSNGQRGGRSTPVWRRQDILDFRAVHGEPAHRVTTAEQDRVIRARLAAGESAASLAREFEVGETTIARRRDEVLA